MKLKVYVLPNSFCVRVELVVARRRRLSACLSLQIFIGSNPPRVKIYAPCGMISINGRNLINCVVPLVTAAVKRAGLPVWFFEKS